MKKNDTTRKSKAMSIASDSGGKNLVVVESPSKTKKLASFLGKITR
jgi:reverse gyrase